MLESPLLAAVVFVKLGKVTVVPGILSVGEVWWATSREQGVQDCVGRHDCSSLGLTVKLWQLVCSSYHVSQAHVGDWDVGGMFWWLAGWMGEDRYSSCKIGRQTMHVERMVQ